MGKSDNNFLFVSPVRSLVETSRSVRNRLKSVSFPLKKLNNYTCIHRSLSESNIIWNIVHKQLSVSLCGANKDRFLINHPPRIAWSNARGDSFWRPAYF